MKKKLLKVITLAFALSTVSMPALHAMEQTGYTQKAYNAVSFAAGFASAHLISTALHESGHALMAETIKPGSVKHIEIFSSTPHILHDCTGISPRDTMAIAAAGPLLGSAGSYACAKALQLLSSGNFKQVLQQISAMPVMASTSESSFMRGLQWGFVTGTLSNLGQMVTYGNTDGKRFLACALYGNPNQKIPNSVAIPWNIALGTSLYLAMDKAAYEFMNPSKSNPQI